MNEIEKAIRSHIEKYANEPHEADCALCIAYRIGLEASKPF